MRNVARTYTLTDDDVAVILDALLGQGWVRDTGTVYGKLLEQREAQRRCT